MNAIHPSNGTATIAGVPASAAQKPNCLHPEFEGIPAELKELKNWVVWRYLPPKSSGGKWRKVPLQPGGSPASSTDPLTWSGFDECCSAYAKGGFSGIGFVFNGEPDENGLVYAGVDFDSKAFAGEGSIQIAKWIEQFGSYVEKSVSGEGLHLITKANSLASGISHEGIELYTSKRYFAMTGRVADAPRPIVAAPSVFAALAQELIKSSGSQIGTQNAPPNNVVPFKVSDWAKHGPPAKFAHLPLEPLSEGLEPNIEEIRSAVDAIPPSAIASEPDWMRLARALAHTAAVFPKLTERLWETLNAASRRAPGYNEQENRRKFNRYIREALTCENPITLGSVYHLAATHGSQDLSPAAGPTGHTAGRAANSGPAGPTGNTGANNPTGTTRPNAASVPLRAVHISNLPLIPPKRYWLHGTDLIRGAVTLLVAPGGRAKSTWLLACGLACASGRPLLNSHVFGGPLRVLCLSTEDGMHEMSLRLRAAMKH